MRLLILGGTQFLGRHVAEEALRHGHELTLFNRGRTDPDAFPEAERIAGDRDGGLQGLEGRDFDAVIDTSGYVPRIVRASAELLRDHTKVYVFVSSISVYAGFGEPVDEQSAVGTLADETVEEVDGDTYGPLKALCEQAVQEVYGERACIVRPGLIVGPHDPTDRFTYWVRRVADGGEVLAPGRPERVTQVIDVRDLATFLLDLAEQSRGGVYNATSEPIPMGAVLDSCRRTSGADADLVWVDEAFLREHEVEPWSDLPAWLPGEDPEYTHFMSVSVQRGIDAGLRFRELDDTVHDTLAWRRAHGETERTAGLTPERERDLLAAWHARGR
jgi:2'-hydroxyisoflavone reductase